MKISACTIAKNEALNIGKSIDSYKDYVDEILIVDTGSIDETVEIAKSKGAKVLNFEWKNDFAAAKNFALDNVSGDWILFLDADEWFDGDTAKNIKTSIERAISLNYDSVACKLINFFTENEIMETVSTIRIFKHADHIRFYRAIHEALFDMNKNVALPGLYSENLVINHSGYMKDLLDKKAKRNKILLDKNFASGNFAPIDYFYGVRENLKQNLEMADYFYKLIANTPDYDEQISTYNISTAVAENKIKLVNFLPDRYDFDYRAEVLKDVQEKYPNNPTFKFYEYILFEQVDKKRAINALKDALEYDKKSEGNIGTIDNNPFYGKKSNVNAILGEYHIFIGNKIKALEYFTESLKIDYKNTVALLGLLYVISNEKTEDMIVFLNSIFDISNKEVEKYLVDSLRITKFKDLFLYYFVDYYKKFEEVEISYFTSRLATGNFEEVIDKYFEVYNEQKDEKAHLLITVALIAGNCKEKFEKVSKDLLPTYVRILNAYFNEQILAPITDNDFEILFNIFKEFAYIADHETIRKFLNITGILKEKFYYECLHFYYVQHADEYVLKLCDELDKDSEIKGKIKVYCEYLKTNIYFRNGMVDKIPEALDKTISGGYLDENVALICEMLEADDEKLKEYFEMLDNMIFMRKNQSLKKLPDILSDSIKFITIDKFEEELKDRKIVLIEENLKMFYDFAVRTQKDGALALAEKYYRLCVKYDYMKDKAYFALGKIYNKFEKFELSYYCYEKAFLENLVLAKEILPNNHVNKNYIFTKKEEKEELICPVCGGETKLCGVYTTIEDEKLSYNDPVIVKYRCCDECGHVFASNDIADKKYWKKEDIIESKNNKIALYYDILEDVCDIIDGRSILSCIDSDEFTQCAKDYGFTVNTEAGGRKFDVIFLGETLNSTYELEEKIESYLDNVAQEGIMVLQFYNLENAFSKLADNPCWVKADVKNVFSKDSLEALFSKFDLRILQTNIDKINKGQMLVFVGR